MKITCLELENFKNQQKLSVVFGENYTNIYGANGAGKTTILDAIHFLLFGKDSKGQNSTEFRPYDKDGNTIHDIETRVVGSFEDNGYMYVLEVVYKEKWTKISGSDERKLTGNTTEYFIDGVPKKAKEYQSFVSEYFMEPWFTITSNPNTFPNLHWQEQRQLLLDLVGDVTVGEVVAANPTLAVIKEDLMKNSVEDLKKKWAREKKGFEDANKTIPARIDEITKSLSGIEDPELAKTRAEVQLMNAKGPLEILQSERAEILNGTRKKSLEAEIKALEAKLDVIRGVRREAVEKVKQPYIEKANNITKDYESVSALLRIMRPQLRGLEADIETLEANLQNLGAEWQAISEEVFSDNECPCCHRPYSEDMLKPMLEQFNMNKANRLEACNVEGLAISQSLEAKKTEKSNLLMEINKLSRFQTDTAEKLRIENNEAMQAAVAKVPDLESFAYPETSTKFWEIREDISLRQRDLSEVNIDISVQLQLIDAKIQEAKVPVDEAEMVIQRLKLDEQARERIAQLEGEKKNNLLRLGEVEQKIFLLGQYTVAKTNLISESINNMFERISFKLFEKNIGNEGIRETCELMMDGVPYRNLSFAEKHIAGMEIIRVISSKRNFKNPVFIDNRESISKLPEAPAQVINFIVSDKDKVVRIEHD